MGKELLKKNIKSRQNGKSALSNVQLPEESKLWDTDRIHPKALGGTYDTLENVRGVDPVSHMERHGNLKLREQELETLKMLIDAREQVIKNRNSCSNRLLAMQRRTDVLDIKTVDHLTESMESENKYLAKLDSRITKHLKSMENPIIKIALAVPSVGPITVAYMLAYVDIEKCDYAGNLWSYVGITKPSHERYEKNVAGGGNKTLRTVLYTTVSSMMKNRNCPYRIVYDQVKSRLEKSKKIVKSRNTQGKLIECEWKDTKKGHRHGAALRQIMKHFLSDWWFVARTLEGLPIAEPYVIAYLGHKTWIKPEERGWVF